MEACDMVRSAHPTNSAALPGIWEAALVSSSDCNSNGSSALFRASLSNMVTAILRNRCFPSTPRQWGVLQQLAQSFGRSGDLPRNVEYLVVPLVPRSAPTASSIEQLWHYPGGLEDRRSYWARLRHPGHIAEEPQLMFQEQIMQRPRARCV